MGEPGILSLIELDKEERELLIDYMTALKRTEVYEVLENMYGVDILKFMDVFAGESIKIPNRNYVYKVIKYIQIYKYCERRDFTEEAIENASKVFDRRKSSITRVIDKVERVLAKLKE